MGEVYRATDSKLRRDIALKILPPDAADAERRDRFAREARAIAALNHPGIVTIHSVEEDAGVHFLTMELVEGGTLAEAISPGGLPLKRLLDIAISLADALGCAQPGHRASRYQTGNVMVTPEGRVKVLDFGLAKLKMPDGHFEAATTLEDGHATREGSIVGTCAYMSPEQAGGRDVDHGQTCFRWAW
jgi:serine/threonine protein kinase